MYEHRMHIHNIFRFLCIIIFHSIFCFLKPENIRFILHGAINIKSYRYDGKEDNMLAELMLDEDGASTLSQKWKLLDEQC